MADPNRRKVSTIPPESRFSKAPPGYSLTGKQGQYAWERPPKYTTPAEAMDSITTNMGKMKTQMMHVKMMMAGVSIEEIVNTTTKLGFMEGMWSVDVAEIIKAPLAWYLMGLAAEAGIDAKVLNTKNGLPSRKYQIDDAKFLNIMRDRNPELARFILSEMPKQKKMEKQELDRLENESFLSKKHGTIQNKKENR
jgi:hypothetical protein